MSSWQISDRAAFVVSNPERVVVLHLDRPGDQPLALLGTGAAIWTELLGADDADRPLVTEADLTERLATRYATTAEAITPQLTAFLNDLSDTGLLIHRPSAGSGAPRATSHQPPHPRRRHPTRYSNLL